MEFWIKKKLSLLKMHLKFSSVKKRPFGPWWDELKRPGGHEWTDVIHVNVTLALWLRSSAPRDKRHIVTQLLGCSWHMVHLTWYANEFDHIQLGCATTQGNSYPRMHNHEYHLYLCQSTICFSHNLESWLARGAISDNLCSDSRNYPRSAFELLRSQYL